MLNATQKDTASRRRPHSPSQRRAHLAALSLLGLLACGGEAPVDTTVLAEPLEGPAAPQTELSIVDFATDVELSDGRSDEDLSNEDVERDDDEIIQKDIRSKTFWNPTVNGKHIRFTGTSEFQYCKARGIDGGLSSGLMKRIAGHNIVAEWDDGWIFYSDDVPPIERLNVIHKVVCLY